MIERDEGPGTESTDDRSSDGAARAGVLGGESGSAAIGPIELSVVIEARPSIVFSLLTDPEEFLGWMGGLGGHFEGVAGTAFGIGFPQFQTKIAGQVVEIVENERLTLTWGVAEGPQAATLPAGSTRLDITLAPEGTGTRVSLRHSLLPSLEERTNHEAGWRFHLGRLSLLANRAFLGAAMDDLVAGFFGAWNEPDPDRRAELLAAVCEPQLEFADDYATLTGLDDLSLHIGNTQMYMPGLEIERDGDVTICLSEALIPWRAKNADDEVTLRGMNLVRVSGDGRLERVKGFWQ